MDATHGGLYNVNMIHHVLINRFVFIYVFFLLTVIFLYSSIMYSQNKSKIVYHACGGHL